MVTLRRRTVLAFTTIVSTGIAAFAAIAIVATAPPLDAYFGIAVCFVGCAAIQRFGLCRIVLNSDSMAIYGVIGVRELSYSAVKKARVDEGGNLEVHTVQGKVYTPACFQGSVLDAKFKTADKAARAINQRASGKSPQSGSPLDVRVTWFQFFPAADVFLGLAAITVSAAAIRAA